MYKCIIHYHRSVLLWFDIEYYSSTLFFMTDHVAAVPAIRTDAYPIGFKPFEDLNIAPVKAPAMTEPGVSCLPLKLSIEEFMRL